MWPWFRGACGRGSGPGEVLASRSGESGSVGTVSETISDDDGASDLVTNGRRPRRWRTEAAVRGSGASDARELRVGSLEHDPEHPGGRGKLIGRQVTP